MYSVYFPLGAVFAYMPEIRGEISVDMFKLVMVL